MRDRFGAAHALKSPAHITLQMPFRRNEEEETAIFKTLEEFTSGEESFGIDLLGFDAFAPRVLFIKIVDHQTLIGLQHRLRFELKSKLAFQYKNPEYKFHPHMTIATRDLSEEAFYEAWPEYEKREFGASFEAKSLFLLKHNGKDWDVYREFPFNG